jgi:flagellar biosynthesis component FlhA
MKSSTAPSLDPAQVNLELGPGLEALTDAPLSAELLRRLSFVRAHLALERGFLLEDINLCLNSDLPTGSYRWTLGHQRSVNTLKLDRYLALCPESKREHLLGESAVLPSYGSAGVWVKPCVDEAHEMGVLSLTPLDVLALDLTALLRNCGDELIDRSDLDRNASETLKREFREEDLANKTVWVLRELYRQGFCVPFLPPILEAAVAHFLLGATPEDCLCFLRREFIDLLYTDWVQDGVLHVLQLTQGFEKRLRTDGLDEHLPALRTSIGRAVLASGFQESFVILLRNDELRTSLVEHFRGHFPKLLFLSRKELPGELKVEVLSQIGRRPQAGSKMGQLLQQVQMYKLLVRDLCVQHCDLHTYTRPEHFTLLEVIRPHTPVDIGPSKSTFWLKIESEDNRMIMGKASLAYALRENPVRVALDARTYSELDEITEDDQPYEILDACSRELHYEKEFLFRGPTFGCDQFLPDHTYCVIIQGKKTRSVSLFAKRYFIPGTTDLEGHPSIEPVSGDIGVWVVDPREAKDLGHEVWDAGEFLTNHLRHLIQAESHRLLSRQVTSSLVDPSVDTWQSELSRFPLSVVQRVFCRLLRQGLSVHSKAEVLRILPTPPAFRNIECKHSVQLGVGLERFIPSLEPLERKVQSELYKRRREILPPTKFQFEESREPLQFSLCSRNSRYSIVGRLRKHPVLVVGPQAELKKLRGSAAKIGFDGFPVRQILKVDMAKADRMGLVVLEGPAALMLPRLLWSLSEAPRRPVELSAILRQFSSNDPWTKTHRKSVIQAARDYTADRLSILLKTSIRKEGFLDLLSEAVESISGFRTQKLALESLKRYEKCLRVLLIRGALEKSLGRVRQAFGAFEDALLYCRTWTDKRVTASLLLSNYLEIGGLPQAWMLLIDMTPKKGWPSSKLFNWYLKEFLRLLRVDERENEAFRYWELLALDQSHFNSQWLCAALESGEDKFRPLWRAFLKSGSAKEWDFDATIRILEVKAEASEIHWVEALRDQMLRRRRSRSSAIPASIEHGERARDAIAEEEAGNTTTLLGSRFFTDLQKTERCVANALTDRLRGGVRRYREIREHLSRTDLVLHSLNLKERTTLQLRSAIRLMEGQDPEPWLERSQAVAQVVAEYHQREFGRWSEPLKLETPEVLEPGPKLTFEALKLWTNEAFKGRRHREGVYLVLHPSRGTFSAGFGPPGIASYKWVPTPSRFNVAIHEFYHSSLGLRHSESENCVMHATRFKDPNDCHICLLQKAICLVPRDALSLHQEMQDSWERCEWESVVDACRRYLKIHPFSLWSTYSCLRALDILGRTSEREKMMTRATETFGNLFHPEGSRDKGPTSFWKWTHYGDPAFPAHSSSSSLFAQNSLGKSLLRRGQFIRSLDCFHLIECVSDFSVHSALSRFESFTVLGRKKKAEQAWAEVEERSKYSYGWIWYLFQSLVYVGEWDRAEAVAARGATLDVTEDDEFGTRFMLGIVRWGQGRFDEAGDELSKSGKYGAAWLAWLEGDRAKATQLAKYLPTLLLAEVNPDSRWERRAKRCFPLCWSNRIR